MPYIKEKCIAGKTIEYRMYYAPRSDIKGGSRKKAENRTSEAQKKVNSRKRQRQLTRILNHNFSGRDLYVTYTYEEKKRPDVERLQKDIRNLMDRLRRYCKKAKEILKYVWVVEVGEKGAVHIHMVLSSIKLEVIKKVWEKGWVTIKPMDDSGQYRKLASYFIKYSEKTMRTTKGLMGKSYSPSKNIIIPEPEKSKITNRNTYSHTIEVPAGYYVDKDSIAEAFHEVTGFMYFAYTLIFDGKKPKGTKKKESYILDFETGEVEIIEKRKEESRMIPPEKRRCRRHGRYGRKAKGRKTGKRACKTGEVSEGNMQDNGIQRRNGAKLQG